MTDRFHTTSAPRRRGAQRRSTSHLLVAWLPVALWVCVIACESTDLMSAQHTGDWMYALLTPIFGPIDPHRFEVFHFLLRKTGHFVGYGILSLLTFRALRISFSLTLVQMGASSVVFSGLIASLDEWHQTYIPSRTGSVEDVLLDTVAAACVQVAVIVAVPFLRPAPARSRNGTAGG